MIDYFDLETTSATPEASSMIETFRAIGYNIETAIADIVDNSISSGAKNIWIDFDWKGSATWLAVKDDGCGMNNDELIQAMRPGSKNPNAERSLKDLGRFGLGLKTASFSQCRKLTVLSQKISNNSFYWTWDLDYVMQTGAWSLIKYIPAGDFQEQLKQIECGTIVIWNDIDRLVKDLNTDDKNALAKFMEIMEQVKKHLAMVFHRFIESGKIKVWFQNRELQAWDPFFENSASTQKFPDEPLYKTNVKIRGYVLPHKSKLNEEEFRKLEGPKGWNEQQGFYIYRNERLLLAGDWLGMYRKEEHYKLARIMIDLPNTLDAEWQIDIKKSIARPPIMLKEQLKAYATKIRGQAVEVYRHKGKVLQRKFSSIQYFPVWNEKLRHGKRFYEINREHPLIKDLVDTINVKSSELNLLFKFIEETIPVPLITIKESEQPEMQGQAFEGASLEPIKNAIKLMYEKLTKDGKSDDQAKVIILNIEPFNLYPHLIENV
ncbi:MAG: ATP-binding protein [Opitutaceae bacterium]|nr:ATP-binding protein [Cytophagales bacterium]